MNRKTLSRRNQETRNEALTATTLRTASSTAGLLTPHGDGPWPWSPPYRPRDMMGKAVPRRRCAANTAQGPKSGLADVYAFK